MDFQRECKFRSHSLADSIEQITLKLGFVPTLKPKKIDIIPSPMKLKTFKGRNLKKNKFFLENNQLFEDENEYL